MILLKIFGALACSSIGGIIGMRGLLYLTIAFVAGWSSFALNGAFFQPLTDYLEKLTSRPNAMVLSFLVLTLIPLLSVGYLGRRLAVRLALVESIPPLVYACIGGGYLLALYVIILSLT